MKTDHTRATARIQTTPGARPKARLLSCSYSWLVSICIQSAVVRSLLSARSGALVLWALARSIAGAPAPAKAEEPKERSFTNG